MNATTVSTSVAHPVAVSLEIESFDAWSPDLDAVAPQSICIRLEAPAR